MAAMDIETLLATMDFSRARVKGLLDTIAKSGQNVQTVLAWRPGPGRSHLAWQAMHLAATHDRYVHQRLQNLPVADEALVRDFAGGSTPSDTNVPDLQAIQKTLDQHYDRARTYFAGLSSADLARVTDFPNNVKRSVAESIIMLAWHEAHHQGQMHLIWNLYKAAHGMS